MPSMMRLLGAAVALSGVASAIPALTPRMIEDSLAGRSLQSPVSGLPGCSKSDQGKPDNEDPTWAVGQSNYTDGEGKFVGTDCTTGHHSSHCWTDYYLVGTTLAYDNWYEAVGDIQCSKGGSCSQSVAQLQQTCKSTTWSSCNGNTTTESCTWQDGNCHSVWAAQRVTSVHGYKRRSCVSPTNDPNANMPNSPKRADGFYTRGMMDFVVPLADGNAVSCDGTCESSYNPGALPSIPGGGNLVPWPTS